MTTSTRPEPCLEVKNVWCPNCGSQRFEPNHHFLRCLHCESTLQWSVAWEEWFGCSSPCRLFVSDPIPAGTMWERSSTTGYDMVAQYNPNTGKKLSDPKVREALLRAKNCLTKKLAGVEHKLEKGDNND